MPSRYVTKLHARAVPAVLRHWHPRSLHATARQHLEILDESLDNSPDRIQKEGEKVLKALNRITTPEARNAVINLYNMTQALEDYVTELPTTVQVVDGIPPYHAGELRAERNLLVDKTKIAKDKMQNLSLHLRDLLAQEFGHIQIGGTTTGDFAKEVAALPEDEQETMLKELNLSVPAAEEQATNGALSYEDAVKRALPDGAASRLKQENPFITSSTSVLEGELDEVEDMSVDDEVELKIVAGTWKGEEKGQKRAKGERGGEKGLEKKKKKVESVVKPPLSSIAQEMRDNMRKGKVG